MHTERTDFQWCNQYRFGKINIIFNCDRLCIIYEKSLFYESIFILLFDSNYLVLITASHIACDILDNNAQNVFVKQ